MAEILLSLTIIGVVAAITLPSLTGNINERTWNTQRKALYARFSQAISLMPALNGYGTVDDTTDTAAETFVTAGLSKVLKINNICDSEHLKDCGVPDKITNLKGSAIDNFTTSKNTFAGLNNMFNGSYVTYSSVVYNYSQTDTKAAAFETANGESIVVYYNPHCVGDLEQTSWHYCQPKICANFIYDLNGSKGPNTVGKDIGFLSAIYPSDSIVVAPIPLAKALGTGVSQQEASKRCQQQDSESRLPTKEELMSMFANRDLLGISQAQYWSSNVIYESGGLKAWNLLIHNGEYAHLSRNHIGAVTAHCVKRN